MYFFHTVILETWLLDEKLNALNKMNRLSYLKGGIAIMKCYCEFHHKNQGGWWHSLSDVIKWCLWVVQMQK